jgi:hypothetical protein
MKIPSYPHAQAPQGLVDWLHRPGPPYSLALGATCNCDISQLGRDVAEWLNASDSPLRGACLAFDRNEVRQLAGDPHWRHSILATAALHGIDIDSGCDYECMVRALAAHGGAVLAGEWALEATANLEPVFRVGLAHCEHCKPGASALLLDPNGYSQNGLAAIIGRRFLRWIDGHHNGKPVRDIVDSRLSVVG